MYSLPQQSKVFKNGDVSVLKNFSIVLHKVGKKTGYKIVCTVRSFFCLKSNFLPT